MLQRLNRWDYAISATCLGHRFNRQIASMAKVVSHSGDGYYYALLGGAIAFSPFSAPFLSLALPAFALELLAYLLLKQIFRRDRPQSLPVFICPSDRFSFPSGHSAGAFVMAACVAEVFPSWAMLAFCWAGLIAFSRVLLGVHFVSDVIAGACLGLVIVYSLI